MENSTERPRDAVYYCARELIFQCIKRDASRRETAPHGKALHDAIWAAVDKFRDVNGPTGEPLKPGDFLPEEKATPSPIKVAWWDGHCDLRDAP